MVLASDPVLDAAAAVRRDTAPAEDRKQRADRRALVAAVKECPLLVVVQNQMPALFPALLLTVWLADPRARVALAFTDDEALSAWKTERHPAMPEVATLPSTSLAGGNVPGRRDWLRWLPERRGPAGGMTPAVIVNPAGPLGWFVTRLDLQQSMFGRRPQRPEGAGAQWRELELRLSERERDRERVDELERAIGADDTDAIKRIAGEPINRIGDPLLSARLRVLAGRRLRAQGAVAAALMEMVQAGSAYAYFGDPYRSVDVLLEAHPWIAGADLSEKDEELARKAIERRLSALELPYRADEVRAILGRDWPPRHRLPLTPKLRKARWQGEPLQAQQGAASEAQRGEPSEAQR